MSEVIPPKLRNVDVAKVRRTVFGYVVALVTITLTFGVFHMLYHDSSEGGARWFDLGNERNLATWFSGVLFLLIGVAAVTASIVESRRNREEGDRPFRLPLLWLGVAAMGAWMSLTILRESSVANERSAWQILFAPAILLALTYMVLFFTNRFAASPAARRGAFTAIGCWTLALLLQGVRGFGEQVGSAWYVILAGELLEILGAVFLLSAIVSYVIDIALDFSAERRSRLSLGGGFLTRPVLLRLAATLGVLAVGAGIIWGVARRQAEDGDRDPGLFQRAVVSSETPVERPAKPELHPPDLAPGTPPDTWFEDLAGSALPVSADETWEAWLAATLFGKRSPAGAAALDRDRAPRIAFLSVSSGETANVHRGSGEGVTAAVQRARQASGISPDDLRSRWVRLDLVDQVELEERIDFRPPLEMELGVHGIAFSRRAAISILPAELAGHYLVNADRAIRPRAMLAWMQSRDPVSAERFSKMLQPRVVNPYRYFTTRAFFFEDGQPLPLLRGHRRYPSLTPEQLLDAARQAGDYLISAVLADGKFVYSYQPSNDDTSERYNMLRHAGTAYSMVELYEVTADERLIEAVRRSLDYLEANIKPCPLSVEGALCVVDRNSIKLGGNALAVIAITKYIDVTGDTSHRHLLEPLTKWMQSVQDDSGEFVVHKQAWPGGEVSDFVSGYYPGEAILALCRAYDELDDPSLLDTATAAARWLIDVRDQGLATEQLSHDHWLLYALNELYRHRRDESLLEHSRRISAAILARQNRRPDVPDWLGSYYKPPRSTPTAIRSEGLAATWALLRDFGDPGENAPHLDAIQLGVQFQLQTQQRPEQVMYYREPRRTLGAFQRSLTDDEIRIDYVQHNISALLALRRILLADGNS